MERCHTGLCQKLMRPRWAGEGWEGRVSFCLIPLVIRQRSGNGLSFILQPIQHAVSAVRCKTFLLWTDWRSCTVMAQFSSFFRHCKMFKIDTKYIVPWQARKKDEKWEKIKAGKKNTNKSIHKDTLWSLYYSIIYWQSSFTLLCDLTLFMSIAMHWTVYIKTDITCTCHDYQSSPIITKYQHLVKRHTQASWLFDH